MHSYEAVPVEKEFELLNYESPLNVNTLVMCQSVRDFDIRGLSLQFSGANLYEKT